VKSPCSPCIGVCKLSDDVCVGCQRTLQQIIDWRLMSLEDRMTVMVEIQSRNTTHICPSCDSPTYCVMEDGKSSNLCWCMLVKGANSGVGVGETCLCKKCLKAL